eukprot:gnl/Dysnectes_brevis/4166_a5496_400.p1 GENE.gnl/Dysnectes_brevis/4166_a5496_400~~gnl/Dysnectes_brevis/4166_a5496_400.p1  ORF type:complete len:621 (-),score=38.70 gnl/Dysnectes_brevis/4166_a5496_400:86-1948(-)
MDGGQRKIKSSHSRRHSIQSAPANLPRPSSSLGRSLPLFSLETPKRSNPNAVVSSRTHSASPYRDSPYKSYSTTPGTERKKQTNPAHIQRLEETIVALTNSRDRERASNTLLKRKLAESRQELVDTLVEAGGYYAGQQQTLQQQKQVQLLEQRLALAREQHSRALTASKRGQTALADLRAEAAMLSAQLRRSETQLITTRKELGTTKAALKAAIEDRDVAVGENRSLLSRFEKEKEQWQAEMRELRTNISQARTVRSIVAASKPREERPDDTEVKPSDPSQFEQTQSPATPSFKLDQLLQRSLSTSADVNSGLLNFVNQLTNELEACQKKASLYKSAADRLRAQVDGDSSSGRRFSRRLEERLQAAQEASSRLRDELKRVGGVSRIAFEGLWRATEMLGEADAARLGATREGCGLPALVDRGHSSLAGSEGPPNEAQTRLVVGLVEGKLQDLMARLRRQDFGALNLPTQHAALVAAIGQADPVAVSQLAAEGRVSAFAMRAPILGRQSDSPQAPEKRTTRELMLSVADLRAASKLAERPTSPSPSPPSPPPVLSTARRMLAGIDVRGLGRRGAEGELIQIAALREELSTTLQQMQLSISVEGVEFQEPKVLEPGEASSGT